MIFLGHIALKGKEVEIKRMANFGITCEHMFHFSYLSNGD